MNLDPEVRAFVERQRVARLATNDDRGAPHVVPVVFAWAGAHAYTAIDEKPKRTTRLRRLRNIAADPHATLLFDVYDEDWSRLGWVMLRGRMAVVDEAGERETAVAALRAKYAQYMEMSLQGPVLRFEVEHVARWGRLGA